jgi:hypothetical protein
LPCLRRPGELGATYCPSCGRKLGVDPGPRIEGQPASGEVYIGGFFGLAKRRGLAYFPDYGLFVTDRRLMILNKNVFPPHGWPWIGQLRDQIELTVNATPARLDQLKKEAEMGKEDIERIQLARPAVFRKGALTITLKSGATTKLAIMDGADGIEGFERAKDLLRKFAPDRLELSGSA